jgi:putative ABC transport system substrate-binding protein
VIGADRTVPYFAATPVSAITAESVENFIAAKRSPLGSARCGIGLLERFVSEYLDAEAQPVGKTYRIGFLSPLGRTPRGQVPASPGTVYLGAFVQGLHDLGYVENRDFVMEYRWAARHQGRLPELAADLVRAHVDIIVTVGTPATMAAKQATQTIPIVFAVLGNPVGERIVASLARPGGNVTSLTIQIEPLKVYQLLKEAVPTVTRVVFLFEGRPLGNRDWRPPGSLF